MFPLLDPGLRDRVRDGILRVQLADTVKARELRSDGTYARVQPLPGAESLDSQAWFVAHPLEDLPALGELTS
jgi:polyphosphate kinase